MRKLLTIGELSKLLCISAHNIRYYEKEGLISPSNTSEAGYRLYDYDDVYNLTAIMILRDSGIPIKKIKKLLKNYIREDYLSLLIESKQQVSDQIKKLTELKEQINNSIQAAGAAASGSTFEIKEMPLRILKVLKRSDFEMNYSIKELFDIFSKNNIDMSEIYKQDSLYYLTDDDISYCIADNENRYGMEAITLDAGRYLCYSYHSTEDETKQRIDKLFEYIVKKGMHTQGDLVMIIGTSASMASENGFAGELQIMIK